MGFIEDELQEVKRLCQNRVEGSKLVSCVRTMVRTEIKRTEFKKIVICLQFPENYPNAPILIELKSKTLSEKLLSKLTNVCEEETKKYLGKPQVLHTLEFVRNFIDENPLSCCYDEISDLKKLINPNIDEIKLKQKCSSVILKLFNDLYKLSVKIIIPDDYPNSAVKIEDVETNFPPLFSCHMTAQARENARKCVEPPLRKLKPNEPPFKPKPSFFQAVAFLIDCIKRLPQENCQVCKKPCLPSNPELVEVNESSPKHIERVYCGHLFHQECLLIYMRTPPFGNKRCACCDKKIYHPKWALSDKLAEDRWAHEQARERELAECGKNVV